MYKPRILFNLDFWMKIVPLEFEIAWGKCNTQYSNIVYINSKNGNSAHYCGDARCEMDWEIELGGPRAAITDNISLVGGGGGGGLLSSRH